jgi:hypothetical protein
MGKQDYMTPNGAREKGAVTAMKEVSMMRKIVLFALMLAFSLAVPAVRADVANQATKVTFSAPVQIPGQVLPAGTYWFMRASLNDRFRVMIFNEDRTKLFATILTNDTQRPEATGHTAFTLADRGTAGPQAIMRWFYPGTLTGHEFVYPKPLERELAKDKHDTVVAGD